MALKIHNEVQTTDLGQSELLLVDTSGVDLFPNPTHLVSDHAKEKEN